MTDRARVAVIGTGWWATYTHIPGLLDNPAAELVAIADRDPQRLETAAEAYGVAQVYEDYRAMLDRETLAGVIVATPHATHFAIARDCLDGGLHVMVEKPLTLHANEARDLVQLAQARGCELLVGYPYNLQPQALRAREVLSAGLLGAVQYINCTMSSRIIELLRADDDPVRAIGKPPVSSPGAVYSDPALSGGGQGHLQMTHPLGLLTFVTGLRAERVQVRMRNHGLPLDLIDAMIVEFAGGALGAIGGTGNSYIEKVALQIHCERGGIDLDITNETLVIRREGAAEERLGPQERPREARFSTARNLVDLINGTAPNGSPGEPGWRAVEILDAAYRSVALDGAAVAIASLYDDAP